MTSVIMPRQERPIAPRFIIGAERSGVGLLSQMLSLHPGTLILSNLFSSSNHTITQNTVSGSELSRLLASNVSISYLRQQNDKEQLANNLSGLSRLTKKLFLKPKANGQPVFGKSARDLQQAITGFLRQQPEGPPGRQYAELFQWMCETHRKTCWIESSAGSILKLEPILALFPDARIVHIHRNGIESALSMRDFTLAGHQQSATSREASLAAFGNWWNDSILHGFQTIPRLSPAQYMEVRYERLVEFPAEVLNAVAEFFVLDSEPPNMQWLRAALDITRSSYTRRDNLSSHELALLSQACNEGQKLLKQIS